MSAASGSKHIFPNGRRMINTAAAKALPSDGAALGAGASLGFTPLPCYGAAYVFPAKD
jgi:hypothetical protein